MVKINPKTMAISMTRGDTLRAILTLSYNDGTAYEPHEGDSIRMAVKKTYGDSEALLVKQIPTDTMLLHIEPEDTKDMAFGGYVYDIELTTFDGDVDTFLAKRTLNITEEVI